MPDIHIVNHRYHVDRISNPDARLIVLGPEIDDPRVVYNTSLFETRKLKEKLGAPVGTVVGRLRPIIRGADHIYFWGVQDVISFALLRSLRSRRNVRIVPDNIEFFLRFAPPSRKTIKGLIKLALYGQLGAAFSGRITHHFGRLAFQLPAESTIDQFHAFYSGNFWPHSLKPSAPPHVTFISQPYYSDHSIDEGLWAARVCSALREIENVVGLPVEIYYHPRDSQTYRSRMEAEGFLETRYIGNRCIGVFSTMLFEAALSGVDVWPIFDQVKDLFSRDYVSFVDWFSKQHKSVSTSGIPMSVSSVDFDAIIPAVFPRIM